MSRLGKTQTPATLEAAEAIALQGLAFLAEEPQRLQRFVTITGLDPAELRARADTPELLAAVLGTWRAMNRCARLSARQRLAPEAIAQGSMLPATLRARRSAAHFASASISGTKIGRLA